MNDYEALLEKHLDELRGRLMNPHDASLTFCDPGKHDIVTPWLRAPTTLREWYPALSQTHCRKCGVTWPEAGKGPRGDHKLGSAYWPAVPVAEQ